MITQENKFISIKTPLGPDVLLLAKFSGIESISHLFEFKLEVFSEYHGIVFEDIIGKAVTISLTLADGELRYINGIISEFSQTRGGGDLLEENIDGSGDIRLSNYTATMVPWPWLLTTTSDSRIFQVLSVPEIVENIFNEKGFSDFRFALKGKYEKRTYCVQYRETDFNFISRLLEEEGIFYFFEHEQNKHTIVIADTPDTNKLCPKQEDASFHTTSGGWLEEDVIIRLEKQQRIRPGKYTLSDYNFEVPTTDLNVRTSTAHNLGPGERELYDYPGLYAKRTRGDQLAALRMEEEEAQITQVRGISDCRSFASGYRFKLMGYYRKEMNEKEYVLTSIRHEASQVESYSGGSSSKEKSKDAYLNYFSCIPFDIPFRPQRLSRKPVVNGAQTAIVVGPAGEEIYTDKHGRVKVQFHWDREGKKNEKSSCWIRVSQIWAGAGWGAMHIPRIGQEVIVDFLEGNPDRPIITGRVYHGNNVPPYSLPDEKTKSTIKSETTPGGETVNELLMEDKSGKTQVVLSNAYGHKITQDEETQTLTIETRDAHKVCMDDKNKNISIQTTKVHKLIFDDENKKIVLKSTDGHSIELDDEKKKITTKTKNGHIFLLDDDNKKIEITTTDGHSARFDDDKKKVSFKSASGHHVTLDDDGDNIILEDAGGNIVKLDGGGKLSIESIGDIDILASNGKINLEAVDINIKANNNIVIDAGADLSLESGINLKLKAGMQLEGNGTMAKVEGSAITEIKGGIVKIN